MVIDIGNLCTGCGKDTAFGSGDQLFVNRIPSYADATLAEDDEIWGKSCDLVIMVKNFMITNPSEKEVDIDGYLCRACQYVECDMCPKLTLEYEMIGDYIVCEECQDEAQTIEENE